MKKVKPAIPVAKVAVKPKKSAPTAVAKSPASKLDTIVTLLKRSKGATMEELMAATGWQRHSVHGTLSGTIRKKRGLPLITEFGERGRSYRIGAR